MRLEPTSEPPGVVVGVGLRTQFVIFYDMRSLVLVLGSAVRPFPTFFPIACIARTHNEYILYTNAGP